MHLIYWFTVRLADGTNQYEGRVEIYFNGVWGTVCDDSWDELDAVVVCRQLGLPHEFAESRRNAFFGQGSGPIFLDNVACLGHETSLDKCVTYGWGTHNCGHGEDAGVLCSDNKEGM